MAIELKHPSLDITPQVQADLIRRALAAWFGSVDNVAPPEASGLPVVARMASKAGRKTDDGTDPRPMWFVVVHAGAVVLAVYKVRQLTGGLMLRRMVRAPRDLVRLNG